MKLDKKQIVIYIGIVSIILFVIISYVINKTEEKTNYEELQINVNKTEEVNKKRKIKVHVAGSVVNEGVVELEEDARIEDAIKEAGGITSDANTKNINLANKLQDGQKIYIPNINEENTEIILNNNTGNKDYEGLVNINTATQTELELLQGIGPSLAIKIIEYRNKNGKFKSIEELKNVPGIGETKYESIKGKITI